MTSKRSNPNKFFEDAAKERLLSAPLKNAKKRRIARRICIPGDRLLGWFRDALKADVAKLTLAACEALSREIQTILNRRNNEEQDLDPSLPDWLSKDPVQTDWVRKKKAPVRLAACEFLVLLEKLESTLGPEPFANNPSLSEIRTPLYRIGAFPVARAPPSTRGRRQEAWHIAALPITDAIKAALTESGLEGLTSAKIIAANPIVIIGAAAISWAYKIKIEPVSFASAMRRGRRTKVPPRTTAEFFASLPQSSSPLVEGVDFKTIEQRDRPPDWDLFNHGEAQAAERRDPPSDPDD